MKRLIFAAVAFLVGCNGMGSGTNRLVPAAGDLASNAASSAADGVADARRAKTKVRITVTVPRHRRRGQTKELHPATISAQTLSFGVAVNGGAARVFNATPSSPGCAITAKGTVCTFVVDAPIGTDTFAVSTYSSLGGVGTMLDHGTATFKVVVGRVNVPSITLGPVVTTTANAGVGSLRYAIGAASAGDTIMLMLPANSTITVTSPLTISNRLTIAGPSVVASERHHNGIHTDATYTGISVSGGGTQQIFVIAPGATASISGLILKAGNATTSNQPGGAIYNAGTVSLVGDVFTANTTGVDSPFVRHAPHARHHTSQNTRKSSMHRKPRPVRHPNCTGPTTYGGAVYNHGTMAISDSTFDGNTAPSQMACSAFGYGGAIFNDEYGVLTSSHNLYTNNSAYEGGAVYNNSEFGQAGFTSDTFDANLGCTASTGCALSGCTGTGCTTYPTGEGAAIYDDQGPGVAIASSVFTGNVDGGVTTSSSGDGGAVVLDTGSPSITGSTFTNNLAGGGTSNCSSGDGGAIYLDSDGPLELDNSTFTGNKTGGDEDGYGGAIYADETVLGSSDTFSSNVAFGTGSACETDAEAGGGAIYADDGATLSATTFAGNQASSAYDSFGGAMYSEEASRLTGDSFTSNAAIATGSTAVDDYTYGGAIYNDDTLTLNSDTFTSNRASSQGVDSYEAYGGAIYNAFHMSSTSDLFTSNSVSAGGTALIESYGGAIASFGTPCCGEQIIVTSLGDTFSSNAATATGAGHSNVYGGAIFADGPLAVSGGKFASNTATGPYTVWGGAVYSGVAGSSISSSSFTSNKAATNGASPNSIVGGAIADAGGMTLNAIALSGNTALQAGGGLYGYEAEAIANSTFTGNTVPGAAEYGGGGGMYLDANSTVVNSTISGNVVTVGAIIAGGGGIYNNEGLSMSGSTVSGNTVNGSISGSGGGGIFNYSNAAITNSTFYGNSTSLDGGGFLQYENYTVTLINVTLFKNRATGAGGNIDNPYAMTLTNSIVAGGVAATGSDIRNTGTLTSGDYNITQTAVSGTAMTGTIAHNQVADPKLLALANNGGPTFTNADQSTSPGRADIPFSAGNCGGATGLTVDQRGFARGAGGRCDVGAFEFAGVAGSSRHAPPAVRSNHHHRHVHYTRPPQPNPALRARR